MNLALRSVKKLGLYLGIAFLGFLAGVQLLYVLWALDGPPMQPWHEIELTEEFTIDNLGTLESMAGFVLAKKGLA